ncbi:MAG: DUF4349 domain-containing protein [Clostridia bacterium]|nr:DUF4349 domain-containing protein [Clostridia bacterium]
MGEEMKCTKFREMLDQYIDDVLSEEEIAFMKAHAEKCAECKEEMRLSDIIKNEVKGMDDDIVVPLQAQAAWRNAVKKEIRAKKFKKAYKAMTGVAAAFIVLVGTTFAMRGAGALPPKYLEPEANAITENAVMTAAMTEDAAPAYGIPETAVQSRMVYASTEVVIEADGETDDVIVGSVDDENIIKSADIVIQSEQIENDIQAIFDLTEEYEGYVSDDIRDFSEFGDHAELVSRIPVDLMDDYISAAENIGEVVSVSRFSQNADEIYYNVDGRLESKIALLEELNRSIKNADEETLLLLNEELNRVYAEIDTLTRLQNTRDNDLMYAKVKITLKGKVSAPVTPAESTLMDRSAKGFKQSMNVIGDFFKDMVVSVAVIAPVVLILAAATLVVIFAVKGIKKNKKKEKDV